MGGGETSAGTTSTQRSRRASWVCGTASSPRLSPRYSVGRRPVCGPLRPPRSGAVPSATGLFAEPLRRCGASELGAGACVRGRTEAALFGPWPITTGIRSPAPDHPDGCARIAIPRRRRALPPSRLPSPFAPLPPPPHPPPHRPRPRPSLLRRRGRRLGGWAPLPRHSRAVVLGTARHSRLPSRPGLMDSMSCGSG